MFDEYQKQAAANKPPRFERVTFGRLRPDDLVWSVMERIYRRADDPEWLFPAEDASVVTYAIREAKRFVTIKKTPEQETPAPTKDQLDLF